MHLNITALAKTHEFQALRVLSKRFSNSSGSQGVQLQRLASRLPSARRPFTSQTDLAGNAHNLGRQRAQASGAVRDRESGTFCIVLAVNALGRGTNGQGQVRRQVEGASDCEREATGRLGTLGKQEARGTREETRGRHEPAFQTWQESSHWVWRAQRRQARPPRRR